MTLEELRLYIAPVTYCMVIDVSDCDNGKKSSKEDVKNDTILQRTETRKYLIWSMSIDKLRGWLVIRVYQKGLFKSN